MMSAEYKGGLTYRKALKILIQRKTMAIVSRKALNDLIDEYNLAASGKYNVEFSKTTAVKGLFSRYNNAWTNRPNN